MNYKRIYDAIIEHRRLFPLSKKDNGENHHIKPRSLFPELIKDKSNIVKLTYREHYICHWLLTKIYPSKEMIIAFWLFNSWNKDKGYINSYAYAKSREEWIKLDSIIHKGRLGTFKGHHHSKETKLKLSEISRNRPKEMYERVRQKNLGMKMSDEFKEKCRKRMLGNSINKDRQLSWSDEARISYKNKTKELWSNEEFRSKMKQAQEGNPRATGKHWKLKEETKIKHGLASRGRHWYNDGIRNYFEFECPKGCVNGMLNTK